MKYQYLLFLFVLLLTISCSEAGTESDSLPPSVEITDPADDSEFINGSIITITAEASDESGIKEVSFFIDDIEVFIDEDEPYTYNWQTSMKRDSSHTIFVTAKDNNENIKASETIVIVLRDPIGNPPDIPANPSPENNATNVSVFTNLSWECSDPDGDFLTYDVYFGSSSEPPLLGHGQIYDFIDPGTLEEETIYFWKIIAVDEHENITPGPLWSFTTRSMGNSDIEWVNVAAGDYTFGIYNVIENIPYDYEIMKYEVTNEQYLTYLVNAYSGGEIWIENESIMGFYVGDSYNQAGDYEFYSLDPEVTGSYATISWADSSF